VGEPQWDDWPFTVTVKDSESWDRVA